MAGKVRARRLNTTVRWRRRCTACQHRPLSAQLNLSRRSTGLSTIVMARGWYNPAPRPKIAPRGARRGGPSPAGQHEPSTTGAGELSDDTTHHRRPTPAPLPPPAARWRTCDDYSVAVHALAQARRLNNRSSTAACTAQQPRKPQRPYRCGRERKGPGKCGIVGKSQPVLD
eukprot:COSAG01_NODE_7018_length_3391_cov_2.202309_4_plen_171_part_00